MPVQTEGMKVLTGDSGRLKNIVVGRDDGNQVTTEVTLGQDKEGVTKECHQSGPVDGRWFVLVESSGRILMYKWVYHRLFARLERSFTTIWPIEVTLQLSSVHLSLPRGERSFPYSKGALPI
eukprot:scaffold11749_cov55-Attheya_sp.AAC.5